jgi:hypothetical protein
LLKWWSIRDVKITFSEDPELEIREIRELLYGSGDSESEGSK